MWSRVRRIHMIHCSDASEGRRVLSAATALTPTWLPPSSRAPWSSGLGCSPLLEVPPSLGPEFDHLGTCHRTRGDIAISFCFWPQGLKATQRSELLSCSLSGKPACKELFSKFRASEAVAFLRASNGRLSWEKELASTECLWTDRQVPILFAFRAARSHPLPDPWTGFTDFATWSLQVFTL